MAKISPVDLPTHFYRTASYEVLANPRSINSESVHAFGPESWPQVATEARTDLYLNQFYPDEDEPDAIFEPALGERPDRNNVVRGVLIYSSEETGHLVATAGQLKFVIPRQCFRFLWVKDRLKYSSYLSAVILPHYNINPECGNEAGQ